MSAGPTLPDLLTTDEVCTLLDATPSTVSRWVRSGRLAPVRKLPGIRGAYLFDPAQVDLLRQRIHEQASAKARKTRRKVVSS